MSFVVALDAFSQMLRWSFDLDPLRCQTSMRAHNAWKAKKLTLFIFDRWNTVEHAANDINCPILRKVQQVQDQKAMFFSGQV